MLNLKLKGIIDRLSALIYRFGRLLTSAQQQPLSQLNMTSLNPHHHSQQYHLNGLSRNQCKPRRSNDPLDRPELSTSPIAQYPLPAVSYLNHC